VVSRLHAKGARLFILTNKPILPTEKILAHFGMDKFFTGVFAPDSTDFPFGSKSEGARFLAKKYRLETRSTVMVGDGLDDAEAAKFCDFDFIAVGYGYGLATQQSLIMPIASLKMISEIEPVLL